MRVLCSRHDDETFEVSHDETFEVSKTSKVFPTPLM